MSQDVVRSSDGYDTWLLVLVPGPSSVLKQYQ